MFLQLLLLGVILECSSLTTTITPTLTPTIAAQVLPSFPKLSKSFSFSESSNNGQQTSWKPIAPPNYHPIQSQNARSGNGNVAYQNKNYESNTVSNFNSYPVFPKSTINFKIDSTGYPMDVKQYTDLSAFKKYQGPNPPEIAKPKYDDIMARLYNDPATSRITPSSRSTRESYKPFDSTKSIEYIPSFTSKSKPFQFQEFPKNTRGFSSKPLNKNFNFRKSSFSTSPSNEGYYSSQDDKYQMRYNPSGPAKKANNNFNTAYGSNGGNANNDHYQLLSSQPQLHFNTQSVNQKSPMTYPSLPFERIRADVEVINKKKKPSFPSHNNDDDDDDGDNDNNQSEEELGSAGGGESLEEVKPSVSSSQNSNPFEMPGSNIFDSYDQTFGNFSNNKFPKRPVTIPVSETVGSIQQASQESTSIEDHKENIEFEDNNDSTSKSAEHYDEAEKRTSDKAQAAQRLKTNSPYKNFGDDFEREFEESYKREIPKEDYKHVKEVPEIDEPVNKKNKYLRKKDDVPSRRVKKYTKTITQRNTPKEYNHYVTYHSDDNDKNDSESRASNKVTQEKIPSKTQPIFGSRIGKPPRRPDDNANKTLDNKLDNKKNIDRSDTITYDNNKSITDVVSNESSKRVMVDVNDDSSKNPFEQMKPPPIHSHPEYFDIYTNAGWKYVDKI